MKKFVARLVVTNYLRKLAPEAYKALEELLSTTKVEARPAKLRTHDRELWKVAMEAHKNSPDNSARQIAFHVRSLPYVTKVGGAYALDGGYKRGLGTFVVAMDDSATRIAVVQGTEPAKAKVVATFSGTLAEEKARTAYASLREGQPYVPKTRGKFAVSTNGAHVNARMVSVENFNTDKKSFEIYKARGAKGRGEARKING